MRLYICISYIYFYLHENKLTHQQRLIDLVLGKRDRVQMNESISPYLLTACDVYSVKLYHTTTVLRLTHIYITRYAHIKKSMTFIGQIHLPSNSAT